MTAKVTYSGGHGTNCSHMGSGNFSITDTSLDKHFLGHAISPTNKVATGLASCIFSVMGIQARELELDLGNPVVEDIEHMEANPGRITRIGVNLNMPQIISDKQRKILGHTVSTCPLHYTLHPDIVRIITFQWGL